MHVTLTSETPSKKVPCCLSCHEVADRPNDPTTIFYPGNCGRMCKASPGPLLTINSDIVVALVLL